MLAQVPRTRWGGVADGYFRPSGYFRIAQRDGVFWLVDPDGGRFLSKGVNTVRFDQDQIQNSDRIPYAEACRRKYGSQAAWRSAVAARLAGWGFNTLGSWSDETVADAGSVPLAVTSNLDLGMSFAWQENDATNRGKPRQDFPDVFDPDFDRHVERRARRDLRGGTRRSKHHRLVHRQRTALGTGLARPRRVADAVSAVIGRDPGPHAASLAAQALSDFENFNACGARRASWDAAALTHIEPPYPRSPLSTQRARRGRRQSCRSGAPPFRRLRRLRRATAERYFEMTARRSERRIPSSRARLPLCLCAAARAVIDAAARHVDVISFNCYDLDAGAGDRHLCSHRQALPDRRILVSRRRFRPAEHQRRRTAGRDASRAGRLRSGATSPQLCASRRLSAITGSSMPISRPRAASTARIRISERSRSRTTSTKNSRKTMTSVNAEAEAMHARPRRVAA